MPLHPNIYLDAGKVGTQSRSTVSSLLVSIAQTSKTPFAVTILSQYHHAARLLRSISDQGSRKSRGASRVLRSSPLILCAKISSKSYLSLSGSDYFLNLHQFSINSLGMLVPLILPVLNISSSLYANPGNTTALATNPPDTLNCDKFYANNGRLDVTSCMRLINQLPQESKPIRYYINPKTAEQRRHTLPIIVGRRQ